MAATEDDILDVRTLIPDTDAIYGENADEYLFSDEEIASFFRLGNDNAKHAAGLAMIAVGNSEALISKVIVTQDLETDGAKAQKEWREAGKLLIQLAREDSQWDGFELINYRQGWYPAVPELTDPPTVWG